MKGYVVTVEFDIDPAQFAAFMKLMVENAGASLRDETGCRHFDVCRPRDVANRVFLYEIYDDEAAFQAHLQTPHFKSFAAATTEMITGRRIVACDLVG
jgi:autoinducer 2-degrading protein